MAKCTGCKKETYSYRVKDGVYCKDNSPRCADAVSAGFAPSALANQIAISKRKYGISMTHAEVQQIRTNKRQADGTYSPHWRYKTSED